MDSPPLLKVFSVVGIFPFKYNQREKCFEKRSFFTYYPIILTILIQTFNVISFYYRSSYILQHFLKVGEVSLTLKVVLALDIILLLILNISSVFPIILKSNVFCQILNQHLYSNRNFTTYFNALYQNTNILLKSRFGSIFKTFLIIYIVGWPVNVFLSYTNFIAYFTLVSYYILFCQFLFGHLYELMLVEKSVGELQLLQLTLCSKLSHNSLRFYLKNRAKCLKVSKRTMKVFQLSQAVRIATVLIILSIYMFFQYERLVKGSIMRQF